MCGVIRTDVVVTRFTLSSMRSTDSSTTDRTDARMVSTHGLFAYLTGYLRILAVVALTVLTVPGM